MKTKIKQCASIFLAGLFFLIIALTSILQVSKAFAYSEKENTFDTTYIESDFGEEVMENFYQRSFDGIDGVEPMVYSFMEYCFSAKEEIRNENYALYLYVYNPGRITLSTDFGSSSVNMATAYDENGEPTNYEVFPLKMCMYSMGRYDKLFYKFRITGLQDVVETQVKYNLEHKERRYDIAGIYLTYPGAELAKAIPVEYTYHVTGYAKGCATESQNSSTLEINRTELETIELSIEHANYRTNIYNDYICDELNTVYFPLSQDLIDKYGGLQKIKASWYEYKTKNIYVTTDQGAYDMLEGYRGKDIGKGPLGPDTLPYTIYYEEKFYASSTASYTGFSKAFNHYVDFTYCPGWDLANDYEAITRFDWLFLTDKLNDYKVSSEDIKDYMKWYTNQYPNQERIHNGLYASGLFADSIDADRIKLLANQNDNMGYIIQEIDAGQKQDLLSKVEQSFWDMFWHGVKYEDKKIDPIVILSPGSIDNLTPSAFGEEYYIGESNCEEVYNNIKKAHDAGENVVLFRFAVTDYYNSYATFEWMNDYEALDPDMVGYRNGYVAQETIFLDFNIITLTFRKEGVDKVIPVVSNPIDIINDIEGIPDVEYDKSTGSGCAGGFEGLSLGCSGCDGVLSVLGWLVFIVVLVLVFKLGKRIWRWLNNDK